MRRPLLVLAVVSIAACGVKAPPRPPTSANPASSGTTPTTPTGATPQPGDALTAPKDLAPMPSFSASPGSNPP